MRECEKRYQHESDRNNGQHVSQDTKSLEEPPAVFRGEPPEDAEIKYRKAETDAKARKHFEESTIRDRAQ